MKKEFKIIALASLFFIVFRKKINLNIVEATKGSYETGFLPKSFENDLKKIGWSVGQDWCAYFVKWYLLKKINNSQHRNIILKELTGSTQYNYDILEKLSRKYDFIKLSKVPKNNAIITWRSDKAPSFGHTGVILNVKTFETLEGNSSSLFNDKDGVNKKIRKNFKINGMTLLPNYYIVK
jgi:hypothetical protein